MKMPLPALLIMGLFFCLPPLGFAKSFDGIVTEVTEGGSGIKATVTDEYGKTEKDIIFRLLPNVDLSDYKSMDKIKEGDRIKIQAVKNADGNWQISKMEPFQNG